MESEDGAKELLLSEGVFRRRHWDDERVLSHVSFTVGQEVRRCLGDLGGGVHSTRAGLEASSRWLQGRGVGLESGQA